MAWTELERLSCVFSAILAPLALGCGAKVDQEPIDLGQFAENLCVDGQLRALGEIAPDPAVEYVEYRVAYQVSYDPIELSEPMIRDAAGRRCISATDLDACNEAFAALPLESELNFCAGECEPDHHSLAYTRGDEVGAVRSLAEVRSFLGPIDTAADAALLVYFDRYSVVCDADNNVGPHDEGYVVRATTGDGCTSDLEQHVVLVREDGTVEILESELVTPFDPGCAIGRMPAGLCRTRRQAKGHPVGRFFTDVARLEAASVTAFEQLSRELIQHRAPRAFVTGALRARGDEVRHARATAQIARRYGGRPSLPRVRATAPRSLVEVMADNAAEGCVRETFGALVAHAQARSAADPVIRRAMTAIARDETRHAALSWSLARWANARMSASERARVHAAGRQAVERFESELTQAYDARVHDLAGMPRQEQARTMYRQLRAELLV